MKVKSKQDIREKKARIKEKLSIRVVGKTTPKEKKGATGELELFKKIAEKESWGKWFVLVPHILPNWNPWAKTINLEDLQPINFSHIKPKGMYPELRLDPDNIEIVSRAYHEWQHTGQIAQVNYPN